MAVKTANGSELMPETERLAGGANFAAVATVLPSGRIQNQLVWVGVEDDRIVVNTETHRAKYLNARSDGRIALVIRDERDPYRYAEVRGVVSETTSGDRARAHVDELAEDYTGKPYPPEAIKSERVMLWVTPERQTFIDQNDGIAD
ncbi:PPOX class F420-dependent oxidoreductase [Sciscionella sediminilitoris]|uniref:PPOX class F420-dependent oxidoreductase n=1 Tax=Sciscionella sediminilitoris TaxID=1445613 RepID=UPI0004DF729C|nr:PPOX class F420-dependent oxidoreductase [Sciscionella sp. SE31]